MLRHCGIRNQLKVSTATALLSLDSMCGNGSSYFLFLHNLGFLVKLPEPRKPHLDSRHHKGFNKDIPYSLGKIVEWKFPHS